MVSLNRILLFRIWWGFLLVLLLANAALPTTAWGQAPSVQWIQQFGSVGFDAASKVAVDSSGVYAVGMTGGALPGQTWLGGFDAYLRKYDAAGNVQWTRQFGTGSDDIAESVAVDASGVYVSGLTLGTLPGETTAGGSDVFVRKYDLAGNVLWTRQFGTSGGDSADAVAADASGVYVAGLAFFALPGQTSAGGPDVFLRKYDLVGNVLWTRQFGSPAIDFPSGVALDASAVYVLGETAGALPGQTSSGADDIFLRKYDASGNVQWTLQYGSTDQDNAGQVASDASGIYIVGTTSGTLPGQIKQGGTDGFVRKYDTSGREDWTRQFGNTRGVFVYGMAADGTGIYVVGETIGPMPGQPQDNRGNSDAFARKYDTNGNELWTKQFAAVTDVDTQPLGSDDVAYGVAVGPSGIYVAGKTAGNFSGGGNAGNFDAFVMRLTENRPYLVGDGVPADFDTAGGFGDDVLNNLDLIYALRAVTQVPGFTPAPCTDRFDAMDSFPLDAPGARGGDGLLNNLDLIRTLRRITNIDTSRPTRTPRGITPCPSPPR